ncbi:MAG TPA: DinB family protein [Gemmatimonadaceae bacterium]|nr:DinB family protein [Gemmatimonadaceae bacterium]
MKRAAIGLMMFVSVPAMAQMGSAPAAPAANMAVTTTRDVWMQMTNYIIKSAEQVSEADYSYRPVATVRTFGELIGHVAGAQYMFCAAATGDAAKAEGDIEKTVKTKAGLVNAIKASTEYCKKAYAQTDAAAAAPIKLFGQDRSRLFALVLNASHNSEHYGNIVTYLRAKGMVPPSSQPQGSQ